MSTDAENKPLFSRETLPLQLLEYEEKLKAFDRLFSIEPHPLTRIHDFTTVYSEEEIRSILEPSQRPKEIDADNRSTPAEYIHILQTSNELELLDKHINILEEIKRLILLFNTHTIKKSNKLTKNENKKIRASMQEQLKWLQGEKSTLENTLQALVKNKDEFNSCIEQLQSNQTIFNPTTSSQTHEQKQACTESKSSELSFISDNQTKFDKSITSIKLCKKTIFYIQKSLDSLKKAQSLIQPFTDKLISFLTEVNIQKDQWSPPIEDKYFLQDKADELEASVQKLISNDLDRRKSNLEVLHTEVTQLAIAKWRVIQADTFQATFSMTPEQQVKQLETILESFIHLIHKDIESVTLLDALIIQSQKALAEVEHLIKETFNEANGNSMIKTLFKTKFSTIVSQIVSDESKKTATPDIVEQWVENFKLLNHKQLEELKKEISNLGVQCNNLPKTTTQEERNKLYAEYEKLNNKKNIQEILLTVNNLLKTFINFFISLQSSDQIKDRIFAVQQAQGIVRCLLTVITIPQVLDNCVKKDLFGLSSDLSSESKFTYFISSFIWHMTAAIRPGDFIETLEDFNNNFLKSDSDLLTPKRQTHIATFSTYCLKSLESGFASEEYNDAYKLLTNTIPGPLTKHSIINKCIHLVEMIMLSVDKKNGFNFDTLQDLINQLIEMINTNLDKFKKQCNVELETKQQQLKQYPLDKTIVANPKHLQHLQEVITTYLSSWNSDIHLTKHFVSMLSQLEVSHYLLQGITDFINEKIKMSEKSNGSKLTGKAVSKATNMHNIIEKLKAIQARVQLFIQTLKPIIETLHQSQTCVSALMQTLLYQLFVYSKACLKPAQYEPFNDEALVFNSSISLPFTLMLNTIFKNANSTKDAEALAQKASTSLPTPNQKNKSFIS